jgi:hypothetical protein
MVSRLDILMKLADMQMPQKQGPLERMLSAVPGVGGLAPFVTAVANPISERVQDNPVGKALTGALLAANARANPALQLFPDSPGARMADAALAGFAGDDGNPYQRSRAANEAGAGRGRLAALTTGTMNATLDPTNLLGPVGEGLQATRLARLGRVLQLVDELQAMPLDLLGQATKRGGSAAKSALLRRVLTQVEPTTGKAGSIPEHLMPLVDGARQLGPELPPVVAPQLPPLHGPLDTPSIRQNVPYREALPGVGRDGTPGLGPLLPPESGPALPPLHGPADPGYVRKNVPPNELIPGVGENGRPGLGPLLPPEAGPQLPPLHGPENPGYVRKNVPPSELIPGIGRDGGKGIGPLLPPSQDIPLSPELGPSLEEALRGKLPADQLIPGIGRNGGKGIGPLLPEVMKPEFPQAALKVATGGGGQALRAADARARPRAAGDDRHLPRGAERRQRGRRRSTWRIGCARRWALRPT